MRTATPGITPGITPGFTLVEALVALLVAAILAAVALPGLAAQLRAARRAEAIATLLQVQQAQERWRAQCPCYAASLAAPPHATLPGGCPPADCDPAHGLGLALTSGRYVYELVALPTLPVPDRFIVQARATGDQAQDRAAGQSCAALRLVVEPGHFRYEPAACFRQ